MDLSIVVPIFNEAENLDALYQQIIGVLKSIEGTSEVLVVDDGSTDGSFSMLEELHQKDPSFGVIRLSRNFGQTAALAAGISHAQGEIIVTLDGDLQNDPKDIPRLVAKLKEGYDLVSGWRLNRKEPFLTRRLPSMIANRLISLTTRVELHDYGCTLKAFRGELAKSLQLYGEMHRFIPALASDLGASITEIPVNDRPRSNGNSKYGLSRTVRVFLDLVTVKFLSKYLTRPIHVFGFAGLVSTLTGSALLLYLAFQRLFLGVSLTNRPSLLLGILLAVMGVQFITMGLLGEMIARMYHEAQGKPIYLERQVLVSNGHPTIRGPATKQTLLPRRYDPTKAQALT